MSPKQPIIWITGASSGIGAELARQLSARANRVVLFARRMDRLTALTDLLPNAIAVSLDLNNPKAIAEIIPQVIDEHGQPDVLFNNAGFGEYRPVAQITEAEHQQIMQVNYHAPASLIHHVLPGMLKANHGHVINIASIAAKFGPWGHGPYAAAKAGLVALTQSLAIEHQGINVHFSYVCPGIIKTEFFDTHGYDTPHMQKQVAKHGIPVDKAVKKMVKLLDKPKLELCVPGHYRMLDFVKALSPSLAMKLVAGGSRPSE
ncbi:MAG TPA: dehydrogenase [Phycisphaerales bacterium]|nr:dehydrogenase [Phycisphaerales bacterium]HCD32553.1 dehydrogenase [Phycisphaerales bacterium]|tara:strand:+ start:421 stop:1200 length:780 start_codon:yes stop_codon:yes gene_type:complete